MIGYVVLNQHHGDLGAWSDRWKSACSCMFKVFKGVVVFRGGGVSNLVMPILRLHVELNLVEGEDLEWESSSFSLFLNKQHLMSPSISQICKDNLICLWWMESTGYRCNVLLCPMIYRSQAWLRDKRLPTVFQWHFQFLKCIVHLLNTSRILCQKGTATYFGNDFFRTTKCSLRK